MQLSVPHRTVADTGSFHVNPEGVTRWLAELDPLDSENDAREVYRGLKHSNRLHNDVDQRRSVLSCFIPILRDLYDYLSELSNAQPLPLTREFARHARLRNSLLREEAFAFKILLSDSEKPLADDARRAMLALSRQAESAVHAYHAFPDALIADAHQLYALAEEHKLLSAQHGTDLRSLNDHYRYILLLSIANLTQQRAGQLQLVLDLLQNSAGQIQIETTRTLDSIDVDDFALDLKKGSRPEPARSVLSADSTHVRWFNIAPLLQQIDVAYSEIKPGVLSVPGSDMLERQSLARLKASLTRSRQRRCARRIVHQQRSAVLGHKEICAQLIYQAGHESQNENASWIVLNQTQYGMAMLISDCRAGMVQVGELVSITDDQTETPADATETQKNKVDALIGVIRWISADDNNQLTVGIEFLARSVMPVSITRGHRLVRAGMAEMSSALTNNSQVAENAIILACKVKDKVLQTILLPSYLYRPGDKLTASQNDKFRNVVLHKCLQSNGRFSQYTLVDG